MKKVIVTEDILRCKGYTGYIFTGNLDLAKKVDLRQRGACSYLTAVLNAGCWNTSCMKEAGSHNPSNV